MPAEDVRRARSGFSWLALPPSAPRARPCPKFGICECSTDISVPYSRSMLFDGLPSSLTARLEDIMDMRLTPSSMRTVYSAVAIWRVVAEQFGWPVVIKTDESQRAARRVAFVMHMMDDTSLSYKSISAYV